MKTKRCCFLSCLFALYLCVSCDDEIPALPLETQEGLNTFGCLINGELIVLMQDDFPFWSSYRSLAEAGYNGNSDTLIIQGYGQNNQSFTFWIANPQLDTQRIDSVLYVAPGYRYQASLADVDGIRFSRLDQDMRVASGTFSFQLDTAARSAAPPLLNVTKGRFDVRIN